MGSWRCRFNFWDPDSEADEEAKQGDRSGQQEDPTEAEGLPDIS
jgi:hypothetical protein